MRFEHRHGRDEPLDDVHDPSTTQSSARAFCANLAGTPAGRRSPGPADSPENSPPFIEECRRTRHQRRATIEQAEKKGFDTGLESARHPFVEGRELPVYVANFVLMDYGTGAIFGCPAHDQRDLGFLPANTSLPVIDTFVATPEGTAVRGRRRAFVPPKDAESALDQPDGFANSDFMDVATGSRGRSRPPSIDGMPKRMAWGEARYQLSGFGTGPCRANATGAVRSR